MKTIKKLLVGLALSALATLAVLMCGCQSQVVVNDGVHALNPPLLGAGDKYVGITK